MKLIQENQEDFERFKIMEEQIKFLQDYFILYLEFYACKGMGHLVRDCPTVYQKFYSQFIALKDNFSILQKRQAKAKRRSQNSKYNARFIIINQIIYNLFTTSYLFLVYYFDENYFPEFNSLSSLKGESSNKQTKNTCLKVTQILIVHKR
ncbi:hypothetical protein ABPG72_020938 [Tetrahymena utriculariae]